MSPAALEAERQRILRDLGLDEASQRRNAELRKRADYAVMEATLGEPIDAAEKREQKDRELQRKADQLRLEAAMDFDTSLLETKDGKESEEKGNEHSVRDLMIRLLSGDYE
jgi:hypothetical protein